MAFNWYTAFFKFVVAVLYARQYDQRNFVQSFISENKIKKTGSI